MIDIDIMYSFITYPRNSLHNRVFLNESFSKRATTKLANITLLDHQQTALSALYDLENGLNETSPRTLIVHDNDTYNAITNLPLIVESSTICYTDIFGSGKTYVLLALILENPIPANKPIMNCGDNMNSTIFRPILYRINTDIIHSTFIVVNASIVMQWDRIIKTHTNLKVFIISDYKKIREFTHMINNGVAYDIFLIKSSIITINDKSHKRTKNIISLVGDIMNGRTCARVIYDDFDMIQNTFGVNMLSALSTIIVSATLRSYSNRYDKRMINAVEPIYTPFNRVSNDRILCTLFNVCNDPKYLNHSYQ